jgi:hypothetical protein
VAFLPKIHGYGVNTYRYHYYSGLFTSINPSYFDVNYRGTIGFDTLPYKGILNVIEWDIRYFSWDIWDMGMDQYLLIPINAI